MASEIDRSTKRWEDGEVIDVVEEMMNIAGNVFAATMFSGVLAPNVRRSILNSTSTIVSGSFRRMIARPPFDRIPYPGRTRYFRAVRQFRDVVTDIVSERRQRVRDEGDLLSALIGAQDDDGDRLTDTEVLDEVSIFIIAGQETVAKALSWALHEISQRPSLQAQLQEEADRVLGGRRATLEDIPSLELTGRILTETLRMWPPIWFWTRRTTEDTSLGDYAIPAGSDVVVSPYALGRHPGLYKNPNTFDPDRWGPDRGATVPRGQFLPFGWGARKCIGDTFATNEAVLLLATIASRWHLTPVSGRSPRPRRTAVLTPDNLILRLQARHG